MSIRKKEALILVIGDLLVFLISLWVALFLRNLAIPTQAAFLTHILPFALLFAVWVVVFYIAGLYEKHTVILKSRLPNVLAITQFVNSGLAVVFFYFIPYFGITPKTILFIYLAVSFVCVLAWRRYGYFFVTKVKPSNAIIIGSGPEMKELFEEVNSNPIYNLHFVSSVNLERADDEGFWNEIVSRIYAEDVSVIAIDLSNERVEPVLPHLYNLIFSKVSFIEMHKVYEDIFDRIPLSLLKYNWFLENISSAPRATYDTLKRIMDVLIALPLTLVPIISFPFVFIAMRFEGEGPIFSHQNRIGQNNQIIRILKFRTMLFNDDGDWKEKGVENKVTKVGNFLRKSRLDEFPQLWNVLKGDISLIGPRPEFPNAVKQYSEEVPYYNVRHLVRPGLSGWGQINDYDVPRHGLDLLKTKRKLSYDLYYIKNRSFLLDLKIALRTLKTLASIAGR